MLHSISSVSKLILFLSIVPRESREPHERHQLSEMILLPLQLHDRDLRHLSRGVRGNVRATLLELTSHSNVDAFIAVFQSTVQKNFHVDKSQKQNVYTNRNVICKRSLTLRMLEVICIEFQITGKNRIFITCHYELNKGRAQASDV